MRAFIVMTTAIRQLRRSLDARFACRLFALVVATVASLVFAGPAVAIGIEEVRWGFDGQVVAKSFNVLSIHLGNNSPETFDGRLRLQKQLHAGQMVGAVIEEPLFLSPLSSRWVQLYPYVSEANETWIVSWGRGAKQRVKFDTPRRGKPARVFLEPGGNLFNRGGSMKRLADHLFPPMVTATDTLETVFLAHAPRWQERQRQAFVDWLYRGGKVHLLHGDDGTFPVFTAQLKILNQPLETFRVGAGHVFRHRVSRLKVDAKFIKKAASTEQAVLNPWTPKNSDEESQTKAAGADDSYAYYGHLGSSTGFFSKLKQMTRADHDWTIIHLLSFAYILLVFPCGYLLSRRRIDYRLSFAALLGVIVLFSLIFMAVGRRGYGEATAEHSVAIARPLDNGFYDVTAWTNLFVTHGDDYAFSHGGTGPIYSTASLAERVNGVIGNGALGGVLVDIPPFSSRPFVHRQRIGQNQLEVKVEKWKATETLEQLVVDTGTRFDQTEKPTVYALYRNRFYNLKYSNGKLQKVSTNLPVSSFLQPVFENQYDYPYGGFSQDDQTDQKRYESMLKPLIAQNLGLREPKKAQTFSLSSDRVRLFVYTSMTPEFFTNNERFVERDGRVLFCIDLFAPEKT